MRILYLSQYFPPEAGATQSRAYEMAANFVQLGHQVTVLAEFPNHPSGIIPPEYRGRLYERAVLDGIDVIRVWIKTSPVKNFRSRMLFYLTYMLNAILAGLLLARQPYDLIYATSPPLFVGGAGLVLSILRRIPLAFEVRDLWPESAVALGELSNPRAIKLATRLEEACYRRARRVVVVTQGFYNRLVKRGVLAGKMVVLPNGANVDLFTFRKEGRDRVRRELALGERFVAVYAGIHGLAQGLETVVEAARLLQAEPDIHILLVGEGPRKANLLALAQGYRLTNLTFLPEQSRERVVDYLSAADVALIPLKKLAVFEGVLPSKMFDAWACERPILLSVDGEARAVMEQAHGGVFVPPENPQATAENILKLKKSPAECRQMGMAGRSFTVQSYSRKAQAARLAALLKEALDEVQPQKHRSVST